MLRQERPVGQRDAAAGAELVTSQLSGRTLLVSDFVQASRANAPIMKMDTKAQVPMMSLTFHFVPVGSKTTKGPARGIVT